MVVNYNVKRCVGCQFCVQVCPKGCFDFDVEENKAKLVQPILCLKCRACELNCSASAIRIERPIWKNFFSQLLFTK